MRFFCSVLFVLVFACQVAAAEMRIDADHPSYHNDHYGYSICWTPGTYSVVESDNGDGITVRDGKGLELRVWGSLEQDVFGLTLEDFFRRADERSAQYKKISYEGRWYVISGLKDEAIYYEKSYYTDTAVLTMLITYPERLRSQYKRLVVDAAKNFKP